MESSKIEQNTALWGQPEDWNRRCQWNLSVLHAFSSFLINFNFFYHGTTVKSVKTIPAIDDLPKSNNTLYTSIFGNFTKRNEIYVCLLQIQIKWSCICCTA